MRLAVLFSLIFVSSTFVGCLGVEDEDKFTWPEKKYADCSLTTEYDLICETYLNLLSYGAPIASLHYEPLDEIWVAYLDGNILGYMDTWSDDQGGGGSSFMDGEWNFLGSSWSDEYGSGENIRIDNYDSDGNFTGYGEYEFGWRTSKPTNYY